VLPSPRVSDYKADPVDGDASRIGDFLRARDRDLNDDSDDDSGTLESEFFHYFRLFLDYLGLFRERPTDR